MDAFDADVLIYAIKPDHQLGQRIRNLISSRVSDPAGAGSVLLLPELLSKPMRDGASHELQALLDLVARLELHPVDRTVATIATTVAAKYRLKSADATHLATAVATGASRFLTNNQKDFPRSITEVDVVYPADLPEV